MDIETRRKRIIFQSQHRGNKEMDMIMGQYCQRYAAELTPEDIDHYEALLEEDDKLLWEWLVQIKTPTNPNYLPILQQMRNFTPLVMQQMQGSA